MKVLVTGGTGVVGAGTVTELVRRGHAVVLVSRHAAHDVRQWPSGVTPWPGDVVRTSNLRGAADGCDVVLHMVGIVDERSEIAACVRGIPTFDVGPRTDVMDACPKAEGMMMLLRSMRSAKGRSV